MKQILSLVLAALIFGSCQKETITIATHVSETFYLDNEGASMRILVEGNTASHTFLIIVHGGPGGGSQIYHTEYISRHIEDKYAVVYWDQRNAGASQGNNNGSKLNLPQMTNDLKKVIELLKARYGQDAGVFILGHSFGGMIVSSFMTDKEDQDMVKGWIMADGSHSYPLNDSLTREMLLTIGQEQVAENVNTGKWEPVVSYCLSHPSVASLEDAQELESFASAAETYFPEVKPVGVSDFTDLIVKQDWPLMSMLFNYLYSKHAAINEDLEETGFSDSLYKIVKPTLILYGKYDFVCPKGLGEDIYNRISTPAEDKSMVISPISGHAIMFQDPVFFCNEVDDFIEKYR